MEEHTYVDLYLTDRYGTARYRVLLADRDLRPRDLRLRAGLDPQRSFSRQKRVRALSAGDTVTFADSATARHHVLQTVGDAFSLLEDSGVSSLEVLANDYDRTLDPASVEVLTPASRGPSGAPTMFVTRNRRSPCAS